MRLILKTYLRSFGNAWLSLLVVSEGFFLEDVEVVSLLSGESDGCLFVTTEEYVS